MNEPNSTNFDYNMNYSPQDNLRREDDRSRADTSSSHGFDQSFHRVRSASRPPSEDSSSMDNDAMANSEVLSLKVSSDTVETGNLKPTGLLDDRKLEANATPLLAGPSFSGVTNEAVVGTVDSNACSPFADGNVGVSSTSASPPSFVSNTTFPRVNLEEYQHSDKVFTGKGSFPMNLCFMLESVDSDNLGHILSWMPCGRAFVVHDTDVFLEVVLPKYFKTSRKTKIRSFNRKLNRWGFTISRTGSTKGAWEHPEFNRERAVECLKKALETGQIDCFEQLSLNHSAASGAGSNRTESPSSVFSSRKNTTKKRRGSHSSSVNGSICTAKDNIHKTSILSTESNDDCFNLEDNNEDFSFHAAPQPLPALPLPPTQTSYVGQDAFHNPNQLYSANNVAPIAVPDWNIASLQFMHQNVVGPASLSSSFTSGATRNHHPHESRSTMQGLGRETNAQAQFDGRASWTAGTTGHHRGVTRASWTAGATPSSNGMNLMPSRCFYPLNAADAFNTYFEEEELNDEPLDAFGGEENDGRPLSQEDLELRAFFERFAQDMD